MLSFPLRAGVRGCETKVSCSALDTAREAAMMTRLTHTGGRGGKMMKSKVGVLAVSRISGSSRACSSNHI